VVRLLERKVNRRPHACRALGILLAAPAALPTAAFPLSMRQIAGELVHLEDLVLRDASYDICSPTHELTRDHGVLGAESRWALSAADLDTLRAGGDARDHARSASAKATRITRTLVRTSICGVRSVSKSNAGDGEHQIHVLPRSPFSPCCPFSRDADGDFIVEASIEVRGTEQATAAGMAATDQAPSLLQRPATRRKGRT